MTFVAIRRGRTTAAVIYVLRTSYGPTGSFEQVRPCLDEPVIAESYLVLSFALHYCFFITGVAVPKDLTAPGAC